MPNCFQLIDKKTNEPVALNRLDEILCEHFDVPCHPTLWMWNWYNFIGFGLATGHDWDKLREFGKLDEDQEMVRVIDYLEEHYTSVSWVEIGKR